jgi:hypothetical protein
MLKLLLLLLLLVESGMADPIHLNLLGAGGEFSSGYFSSSAIGTGRHESRSPLLQVFAFTWEWPLVQESLAEPMTFGVFRDPFPPPANAVFVLVIAGLSYAGPEGWNNPYGIGGITLSLNHFNPLWPSDFGPALDPGFPSPVSEVPEPATLALLGSGLATLVLRKRWHY